MRRLKVILSKVVRDQIAVQVLRIAEDSIDNALGWEKRLSEAIQKPGGGSGFAVDKDASDRLGYTVRRYTFDNTYLVHFVVDKAARVVRVVNFRHGARLPTRGEP